MLRSKCSDGKKIEEEGIVRTTYTHFTPILAATGVPRSFLRLPPPHIMVKFSAVFKQPRQVVRKRTLFGLFSNNVSTQMIFVWFQSFSNSLSPFSLQVVRKWLEFGRFTPSIIWPIIQLPPGLWLMKSPPSMSVKIQTSFKIT